MNSPFQTQPTPAGNDRRTPDRISQELTRDLTTASLEIKELGNGFVMVLPPGFSHVDLTAAYEKTLEHPMRKRGEVQLKDVASLLAYISDQAAEDSGYLYADPDAMSITAVLNDQRSSAPGWRDFRATFKAEFTPEFQKWKNHSGQAKSQTEFAEFIEDNFADIAEPAAQHLLDVATTIQATTGINFSSAKRLQDGQVQLTYNENIEAKAGANGALTIPKEFTLGLRIFKNGEGYRLKARLKYRLSSGSLKFWYELDRPERSIEDAFEGYLAKVRESGYTVLLGKAD